MLLPCGRLSTPPQQQLDVPLGGSLRCIAATRQRCPPPRRPPAPGLQDASRPSLHQALRVGLDRHLISSCHARAMQWRLLALSQQLAMHFITADALLRRQALKESTPAACVHSYKTECAQPISMQSNNIQENENQRNDPRSATAKRSALAPHLEQGVH